MPKSVARWRASSSNSVNEPGSHSSSIGPLAVASHFAKAQVPSSPGHAEMVASVERIECVVVASEAEALLAEQSFIKQYRPRFNIRLRDDKSYPFIAISLDEEFPRVYFTRERHRTGRAYFGPYSNAKRVRGTLP